MACTLRIGRLFSLRAFAAAAFFFQSGLASSATFNIANGNITSLKAALLISNANGEDDTINLARGGSYTLQTPLITNTGFTGLPRIESDGGHSLTIHGSGSTVQRDTAAGTVAFRLFDVDGAATVTFDGVTFKNGHALAVGGTGPPYDEGGAICNRGGTLKIQNCTFNLNQAGLGGAIFNDNKNNRDGDGIIQLLTCIFNDNRATRIEPLSGGGGAIYSGGTVLGVNRCVFNYNHAEGYGGAIDLHNPYGHTFTIIASGFEGNTANRGGAVHCYGRAIFELTRCTFTGNSADSQGGAISGDDSSEWTLADCSFAGNTTPGVGGAIGLEASTLMAARCTLIGNTADTGGGIDNYYAKATLANCTLSENSAARGGGISNRPRESYGSAELTVTNCTLSNNAALETGGGIYNYRPPLGGIELAELTIANSILKKGAAGSNIDQVVPMATTSLGHNLSDDAAGGDGTTAPGGFLNGIGDIRNTDPMLDPIGPQNNGGQTHTIALLPASPAINHGGNATAPPRDQRGYLRAGPSEIGAFEFAPSFLRLVDVARSGNDVVVSCEVVERARYRLERKLSLTEAVWQNLSPGVPDLVATGNDIETITDPTAIGLGSAFYRVSVVP